MTLRPAFWSVFAMILTLSLATRVMAVGPYTWDGGGTTDNLLENSNWSDDIGPQDSQVRLNGNNAANVDTSIIFAGTTRLTPYVHAPGWSSDDAVPPTTNPDLNANNIYNNVTFDSTAGPFVISLGPGNTTGSLRFGPTSQTTTHRNLVNNSSNSQTFNLNLVGAWVDVAANTGDFIFNGSYNMAVGSVDRRLSISGNFGVHFNAGLTGAGADPLLPIGTTQRPGGFLELLGPGKSYITASSDSGSGPGGLWDGRIIISNGVLEISHNTALGAGFAQSATSGRTTIGTAVTNTGRLELAGDAGDDSITSSERIFITGRSTTFETAAAHIRNLHGNNTLSGPIESENVDNSQSVVIEANDDGAGAADLLTISGNLTQSRVRVGGVNLVLGGNGAGVISGNMLNGTTPETMTWALRKLGAGTWTINSSGNNYTGATQVAAGTLALGASGSIATSSTIQVDNGATLDVSSQPNYTVGPSTAQILKGDGAITGNVAIATGSTFSVDYGGSTVNSLSISGEFDITNATLNFNQLSPLDPGVYVFATYGTLEGAAFANVLNKPVGFNIDYDYGGNQIALVAVQAGDFDADGDVDGADFIAWQTNFPTNSGATPSQGDADNDTDVDGADFAVWQSQFPAGPGPGASPVPEPASGILLAACGVFAFVRRRTPMA